MQGMARGLPGRPRRRAPSAPTRACARRSTRTAPPRTRSRATTGSSTTRPTARPGVYSMIGGKLASYRLFAQELCDLVARATSTSTCPARRTSVRCPAAKADRLRPDERRALDTRALSDAYGITPVGARRLVYRHGTRALRVLERAARRPSERDVVCPCEPVLEAEVRHVVTRRDGAHRRRRRAPHAARARRLRGDALRGAVRADRGRGARRWRPPRGERWRCDFLERQARARMVALGPAQARQEALALAHVRVVARRAGVSASAPRVIVVGAGVAGAAAALAAARSGGARHARRRRAGSLDARDRGPRSDALEGRRRDRASAAGRGVRRPLGARRLPRDGAGGVPLHDSGCAAAVARSRRSPPRCGPVGRSPARRRPVRAPGLGRRRPRSVLGRRVRRRRRQRAPPPDERALPDADFAARHDDESRLAWLAERLREARAARSDGEAMAGFVLPPSLGVERARAAELSRRVGLPCGEALALPGGPSGLRFERARDRALSSAGVRRVRTRARQVEPRHDRSEGGSWRVTFDDGSPLDADAVVLAAGGLLGGGIEYAPSEAIRAAALPPSANAPLRASLDAPLRLGAHGRALEVPGSLFGLAPEHIAWPFSADGLLDARRRARRRRRPLRGAAPGLFAAGEIVADAPRTWLRALDRAARTRASAPRGLTGERIACARTCQPDLEHGVAPLLRVLGHVARLAARRLRDRRAAVAGDDDHVLRLRLHARRTRGARCPSRSFSRYETPASSFPVSTVTSGCTPSAWIARPLGV